MATEELKAPDYTALRLVAVAITSASIAVMIVGSTIFVQSVAGEYWHGWAGYAGIQMSIGLFGVGFGSALLAFRDMARNSFR